MKKVLFAISLMICTIGSFAQTGVAGTVSVARGAGAIGNYGDIQTNQFGHQGSISGFNINSGTGVLLIDSEAVTNYNRNLVTVDTTVTDTVRLIDNITNTITTTGNVRTLVIVLPTTRATGYNIKDNDHIKVKFVKGITNLNVIQYTGSAYTSVYSGVVTVAGATQEYFYFGGGRGVTWY